MADKFVVIDGQLFVAPGDAADEQVSTPLHVTPMEAMLENLVREGWRVTLRHNGKGWWADAWQHPLDSIFNDDPSPTAHQAVIQLKAGILKYQEAKG